MLGKDPESTTAAEMDELDAKIACGERCGALMTWRTAITHWHHWYDFRPEGSDADMKMRCGRGQGFRCFHCRLRTLWDSGTDVISHLLSFHQKSNPVIEEDFGCDKSGLVADFQAASVYPSADEKALDLPFEEHLAMMALPFAQQCAYMHSSER